MTGPASAVAILMLAFSLPAWLQPFVRSTNSHAAAARGVKEYQSKQFGPSAEDFAKANALHPSATNAFNLGTARIAAGKGEEGSKALAEAIGNPSFRASALYNRGNGALARKVYESAVKDYEETLRLRPSDAAAKRNLEIALRQLEQKKEKEKQQSQGGKGQKPQPQQAAGGQKPQAQPAPGGPRPGPQGQQGNKGNGANGVGRQQPGSQSDEALLRAIQQQEGEELQRMKRARAEGQKVGW